MAEDRYIFQIEAKQQFAQIGSEPVDPVAVIGPIGIAMAALIICDDPVFFRERVELPRELLRRLRPAMKKQKRGAHALFDIVEGNSIRRFECPGSHSESAPAARPIELK